MAAGFGSKVVQDITGVSRAQLQYWDRMGVVRPSMKVGAGKGSRKEYSFKDLVQLKVAKSLREEGISLQKIRKTLEYLRKNFPDVKSPLAELRLLTNGVDIFVLTARPEVILDALKGQFVFSFALGELIAGLLGEIRKLEIPKEVVLWTDEKQFTAILTPDLDDGGYTVACKEIPAAISQGETISEALDNIKDAIELCLETEKELSLNRVNAQ